MNVYLREIIPRCVLQGLRTLNLQYPGNGQQEFFATSRHKKPGALQRMPPAQEPLPPLQPARPEVTSQRFYIQSFWSARVCKSYITEHPSTHALHVQISKVGASHDEHCPISPGNHSVLSSQAFTELIFAPRTQHSTKAMTIRVVICTIAPRKSLWALMSQKDQIQYMFYYQFCFKQSLYNSNATLLVL